MEVRIEIDPKCREPVVIIRVREISDDVNALVNRIHDDNTGFLTGYTGTTARIIDRGRIIRVMTEGSRVIAETDNGTYRLRGRLYQIERHLSSSSFTRISQSEIINIHRVDHFDLSLAGTIQVIFDNGSASFVSRRYVPRIRALLDAGGNNG